MNKSLPAPKQEIMQSAFWDIDYDAEYLPDWWWVLKVNLHEQPTKSIFSEWYHTPALVEPLRHLLETVWVIAIDNFSAEDSFKMLWEKNPCIDYDEVVLRAQSEGRFFFEMMENWNYWFMDPRYSMWSQYDRSVYNAKFYMHYSSPWSKPLWISSWITRWDFLFPELHRLLPLIIDPNPDIVKKHLKHLNTKEKLWHTIPKSKGHREWAEQLIQEKIQHLRNFIWKSIEQVYLDSKSTWPSCSLMVDCVSWIMRDDFPDEIRIWIMNEISKTLWKNIYWHHWDNPKWQLLLHDIRPHWFSRYQKWEQLPMVIKNWIPEQDQINDHWTELIVWNRSSQVSAHDWKNVYYWEVPSVTQWISETWNRIQVALVW